MDDTLPPALSLPPSRGALRSRARAAGIHLGLSALVAALAATVVLGIWFPHPFRSISGGRELFQLIVAVDVVIGPLITFTVFDRRKPRAELRRDLGVVALLQVAALVYGLHTVFVARPVVLALEGERRIRVVRAIDLDANSLPLAPPELRSLSWVGPRVVATRRPTPEESFEAIQLATQGLDLGLRPGFWLPAAQSAAVFARSARSVEELRARHAAHAAELDASVGATGIPATRLGYLPVLARRSDWVALVDTSNGAIVGYAPIDGF